MKTTVQILKDAKQLLIDKGWTQGQFARDDNGYHISHMELLKGVPAACYCGVGALFASSPNSDKAFAAWCVIDAVAEDAHFPSFNDAPGRTLDEVLAKFDEAIAAEEAKVAEAVA